MNRDEDQQEEIVPKKRARELSSSDQAWILSYSDLMTLLACFFILLMVFADYDPKEFQHKVEQVAQHFDPKKIPEQQQKTQQVAQVITNKMGVNNQVSLKVQNEEISIIFQGTFLFADNGLQLLPDASQMLDSIIGGLQDLDPNLHFVIEGHANTTSLEKAAASTDHWQISGARAAVVARRFEQLGLPPKNIRVLAMGSSTPLVRERDSKGELIPANQALNRRVVVKVLASAVRHQNMRLGLGALFMEEAGP